MKPILLDTDTLSFYLRHQLITVAHVEKYMREHRQLNISLITYYEVLHGLYYRDAHKQLAFFEHFITSHQILPLTHESVKISAQIFADLRRNGQPIGHTDTLIAGVAMANQMQLATNNTAHFERITGLELVNWTL